MAKFRWNNWSQFVLSHCDVALAGDMVREQLPPAVRAGINRIMRECIIGFTNFDGTLSGYSSGGNTPSVRNIIAGIAALAWGRECGYPGWESVVWKASETVRQYLRHGCDSSGFSYEGTGYGNSMFIYVYLCAQLMKRAGVRDLFAEEPVLGRIPDAAQQMLLDDHSFAATANDHGTFEPWSMWWLLLTSKYYNRPDHLGLWHAFQGPDHPIRPYGDAWPWYAKQTGPAAGHTMDEKPDPSLLAAFLWWDADAPVQPIVNSPLPLAQCAEGTGTATFRTSWTPGGVFAALLGAGRSHTCFGHGHIDCGHFDISAYGQYIAIDTGRYNVPENQHSVVLIEGKERHRDLKPGAGMVSDMTGGRLCDFQRGAFVDYCRADAAQIKNCLWADRHFFFMRTPDNDAYIATLDSFYTGTSDVNSFCWQLQANPAAKIAIAGDRQAVVSMNDSRLDISFFMKANMFAPGAEKSFTLSQDIQEWVWPYGRDKAVAQMEKLGVLFTSVRRPRLVATQKSVSCFLGAVISPRRKAAPARAVKTWDKGNLVGVTVAGDGFEDTILIANDHAYIDTPEYYGLCEFAVVRRDAQRNILGIWTKGNASLKIK